MSATNYVAYSPATAAKVAEVSRPTIYRWMRLPGFPVAHIGGLMKTFDINEKIVVSIDPDSAEFAGRVFDTLSAVDKKQRRLIRAKGIASADYYDLSKSTERSMRQQIDTLFNAPVCEAVFGADPIFALSGGCPLWFNLLEGIIHTLSVPPTTECRRIMKRYAAKRR